MTDHAFWSDFHRFRVFICVWLLFIMGLCVCGGYANANASRVAVSAAHQLEILLTGFHTYQATFSQKTFNEKGELQSESHGQVKIKRPGKFRWDVSNATKQIIVATRDVLWTYDIDLAQVSKQSLKNRLAVNPADFLSGKITHLEKHFTVQLKRDKQTLIFKLLPKQRGQFSFQWLAFYWQNGRLVTLKLLNQFDQINVFSFRHIQLDHLISNDVFQLTLPPGVDVIDHNS